MATEIDLPKMHNCRRKLMRRRGVTLIELIAVLLLIGIISAVSGTFMAPMAQSFLSGRKMLRVASASEFAMAHLNYLMSRALAHSIVVGDGQIDFDIQTDEETTRSVQVRYDSSTKTLLVDASPLLWDISSYEVSLTNDGAIDNRITYQVAPTMPIELIVFPRNR